MTPFHTQSLIKMHLKNKASASCEVRDRKSGEKDFEGISGEDFSSNQLHVCVLSRHTA